MKDTNRKKLSGEKAANQLVDKLTSGIFKKLSDHELDIFKQQLATRLKLIQDGPPSNINEGIFSPNYLTTLRPEGRWSEPVEVMVYKNEDGSYKLGLNVYIVRGNGPMSTRSPKFLGPATPVDQFTVDYVLDKINTAYNLTDQSKKELTDFVNNIPSQLRALEVKKDESPLRERLKDMIRKELMGDNKNESNAEYIKAMDMWKRVKQHPTMSDEEKETYKQNLLQLAKKAGIELDIK
jgi:hypothetical protein